VRGDVDLFIVHGKVGQAAPRLEQRLGGGAVFFVLFDGVLDVLAGELVFQFGGKDGQAVEKEGQVELGLAGGGLCYRGRSRPPRPARPARGGWRF